MGYSTAEGTDDFEKLRLAFAEVAHSFGSVHAVLEAFGLSDMPVAQRYGIAFGCLVFLGTMSAVIGLLVFGGSFARIAQQAETGEATLITSHDAREKRPLLLENLLDGRRRMESNYPAEHRTGSVTNLTKMLCNEAPGSNVDDFFGGSEDDATKGSKSKQKKKTAAGDDDDDDDDRYIPPHYQTNYERAYRKCQDRPGGSILSGLPEARFEAYARGYAGCGPDAAAAYRRSYGRLYESICCSTHASDARYARLFQERPHDVVGRYVRLEPLQADRHLEDMFRLTSGEPVFEHKSYDPQEVWSFQEAGPFHGEGEMRQSFVFQRKANEAAFAIVNSVTDRLAGAIFLINDDPKNLSIQLEAPLMQPEQSDGRPEQIEACFLLMDRLFAFGYRRIQVSIDSQDALKRKLVTRLGFTLEGILYRHLVVKDSSRDSNVYSMLNSDWRAGGRAALFKKLYGASALRFDTSNEKREEEFDEQQRVLAEQKRLAEEAEGKKAL